MKVIVYIAFTMIIIVGLSLLLHRKSRKQTRAKIDGIVKNSACIGYIINNHRSQYECLLRVTYVFDGVLRETSVVSINDVPYHVNDNVSILVNKYDPIDVVFL